MNPLVLTNGYKTYVVGLATVAFGIYQFAAGDINAATTSILTGLGILFGRHALQKIESKVTYVEDN